MTKKHFIALADVMRTTKPETGSFRYAQWALDRDEIADFCRAQNSRFNRQRWLDYIDGKCGPNGSAR